MNFDSLNHCRSSKLLEILIIFIVFNVQNVRSIWMDDHSFEIKIEHFSVYEIIICNGMSLKTREFCLEESFFSFFRTYGCRCSKCSKAILPEEVRPSLTRIISFEMLVLGFEWNCANSFYGKNFSFGMLSLWSKERILWFDSEREFLRLGLFHAIRRWRTLSLLSDW